METPRLATDLNEKPNLKKKCGLTKAFSASLLLVFSGCVEKPYIPDDEGFISPCDNPVVRSSYSLEEVKDTVESVPVCVHVVYSTKKAKQDDWSDSTGSFYESWAIDNVNDELRNDEGSDTLIRLRKARKTNTIVKREWANMMDTDEDTMFQLGDEMREANNFPGCVNVYFVNYSNGAGDDGFAAVAFAAYPGEDSGGMVSMVTTTNEITHEWGHILGLHHTHEREHAPEGLTNPDNCYNNGDLLCDTAPDPGLVGIDDEDSRDIGCQNFAAEVGGQMDQWTECTPPYEQYGPTLPVRNHMSYYNSFDWKEFTEEQGERMRCVLDNHSTEIY